MFLDPPQGSSILARAGQQCQPRIQEGLPSNTVSLFYIVAPKMMKLANLTALLHSLSDLQWRGKFLPLKCPGNSLIAKKLVSAVYRLFN